MDAARRARRRAGPEAPVGGPVHVGEGSAGREERDGGGEGTAGREKGKVRCEAGNVESCARQARRRSGAVGGAGAALPESQRAGSSTLQTKEG